MPIWKSAIDERALDLEQRVHQLQLNASAHDPIASTSTTPYTNPADNAWIGEFQADHHHMKQPWAHAAMPRLPPPPILHRPPLIVPAVAPVELDRILDDALDAITQQTSEASGEQKDARAEAWVDEFTKEQVPDASSTDSQDEQDDIRLAAQSVLDRALVESPAVSEKTREKYEKSRFFAFMRQLADGQVTLKDNQVVSSSSRNVCLGVIHHDHINDA